MYIQCSNAVCPTYIQPLIDTKCKNMIKKQPLGDIILHQRGVSYNFSLVLYFMKRHMVDENENLPFQWVLFTMQSISCPISLFPVQTRNNTRTFLFENVPLDIYSSSDEFFVVVISG
jgi:hypothetical protein